MTIEYDYTWEDYRDAARAVTPPPASPPPPRRQSIIGLLLIVAVILGSLGGAISAGSMRKTATEQVAYTLAIALFPLGMLGFIVALMRHRRRLERTRPHAHYIERMSALPTLVMIIGVIISAPAIFSADPAQYPAGVFSLWERFRLPALCVAGAAVVITILALVGRHARLKQIRAAVEARPHVIVRINDDEITFDTGAEMSRTKWAAMQRFSESPDVFLIYPSAVNSYCIVKRAMSSQQVEELRSLLLEKIQPQTGGFPIQMGAAGKAIQ